MPYSVHNLYLSTTSTINPPTNSSNLGSCSWTIDWGNIFHGKTGECQVYLNLKTNSYVGATFNENKGTIRANFSAPNSNSTNQVVLGQLQYEVDWKSNVNNYLYCNTTQEKGVTIHIPQYTSNLNLTFFNPTETGIVGGVTNYEVVLTFVCKD
jgi:hypothetical protein